MKRPCLDFRPELRFRISQVLGISSDGNRLCCAACSVVAKPGERERKQEEMLTVALDALFASI